MSARRSPGLATRLPPALSGSLARVVTVANVQAGQKWNFQLLPSPLCSPAAMPSSSFSSFVVGLPGVWTTSKKSRRAQKSRRRRNKNKIRFPSEIDLLVFFPFPYQAPAGCAARSLPCPSLGAVNLISEALFDPQLKQTRGKRTARSCRSFQLSHPVWPSGVGAPGRSHPADYLCRL